MVHLLAPPPSPCYRMNEHVNNHLLLHLFLPPSFLKGLLLHCGLEMELSEVALHERFSALPNLASKILIFFCDLSEAPQIVTFLSPPPPPPKKRNSLCSETAETESTVYLIHATDCDDNFINVLSTLYAPL